MKGASVPDQALAVPAKPASGLDPTGFDPSRGMLDIVAKAIFDAEDPLSGDHVATVIHLSEHLFWDESIFPGASDFDQQMAAVRIVCRAAAMAALDAIATEARRAETQNSGSVHEGAGPQDIAQTTPPESHP